MGVVTESYINLNKREKVKFEEIRNLINECIEKELIDISECALITNSNEEFSINSIYNGEKILEDEEFKIAFWGNNKIDLINSIRDNYSEDYLIIYLGCFHLSLQDEFEFQINREAPILLFIFKNKIKPNIFNLYGDLPEDLINEDEPTEKFGDETTIYIKISSKIAPYSQDLMNSRFGKYLKTKFHVTFETGYI